MKTKDNEKNRKIDLLVKIVLIVIIIILLIHNCMLRKKKYNQNIIDIDCDNGQCMPMPTPSMVPTEIVSLAFASDEVSIKKGDTLDLIVMVNPIELSSSKFTWTSSSEKVATVDENGTIKGISAGTATITVTSPNGKKATCTVKVIKDAIAIKSISLRPNKTTIKIGSSSQIIAVIKPSDATNRNLVWTSSNPSIATVNNKGIVKGLKAGTVTITARTKDGKVIATSVITIEKPKASKEIESLSFAQTNVGVKKGDTLGLVVTVKPTELSSSKLTWTSSDVSVATVDSNGVVTGVGIGKTVITVTSANGKKTTCIVEVTTDTIEVKEIKLMPAETKIEIGSTTQVEAVIKPENATDRELIWTSSDSSIATIDDKGIVKGLKSGTVTITAKTKDGKVVATATIKVEVPVTPSTTPKVIESLSFAQTNVSVKKGDTLGLVVTVKPTELSSSKLTWTSSNEKVATVDDNGIVKGLKEGTAIITVTSANGKKATCTIKVTTDAIAVSEIELTPDNVTINVGEQTQITATIKPENATDRELVWTSSDEKVATVNNSGVITGKKAGVVTITAKTRDGKVVATSTITIEVPVTPTPTPTQTPEPEVFNVYDKDKPPITWNGSSDLKIFTNSIEELDGVIAPESKNTYELIIKNNTEYNMKYSIEFIETNDYSINMKYKLKKNDTYIVDHYVTCGELNVINQLIDINDEDTYYLEWYWESSTNDTEIGANLEASYRLQIKVEAESIDG